MNIYIKKKYIQLLIDIICSDIDFSEFDEDAKEKEKMITYLYDQLNK